MGEDTTTTEGEATKTNEGEEPSMEEILSSIRKILSEEESDNEKADPVEEQSESKEEPDNGSAGAPVVEPDETPVSEPIEEQQPEEVAQENSVPDVELEEGSENK